jgi:hypothetical protein
MMEMRTANCRRCAEPLNLAAKVCLKCKEEYSDGEVAERLAAADLECNLFHRRFLKGFIGAGLVFLLIALLECSG